MNAGVGLTQELRQFAPLCSVKLFSDTLPLCSRYRFENLSLASLCLNLASAAFPCHPIPECIMLNLFQHLTVLVCDLCKILNSLKIALETKTHNNIINNDFLRFQDDNKHPSQPSLNREGVRPIVQSTLSPRPLWRRAQSCLSREAKATNAGEGLKTINQQYPPTVSDHFPLRGGADVRRTIPSLFSLRPARNFTSDLITFTPGEGFKIASGCLSRTLAITLSL